MLNRVVLVGRTTKDVEIRYTPGGVAVSSFTIAVNRTFSNGNGEKEADFINCIAWKKVAENTANFVRKGHLIGVDGRIQTRSYDGNDGKKVYVTEVVAESVQFLEPKKDGQGNKNSQTSRNSNQTTSQQRTTQNTQSFRDLGSDDLPF